MLLAGLRLPARATQVSPEPAEVASASPFQGEVHAPMSSVSAIALSGMNTATASLGIAGHNLANLGTAGFRRQLASPETLASGGVVSRADTAADPGSAIEADMVGLLSAKHAFLANLAVFRTSNEMTGTLLDTLA